MARVTTLMAAMAASPYRPALRLRQMVAMLASPWRHRDGTPPLQISTSRSRRMHTFRRRMRRLPPREQPKSSMQNDASWLRMVARAAPATPISNTKISNGSSPTFSTAPAAMPTMP